MRVLVIAEHDHGTLRPASLSCLAFAKNVVGAAGGEATWLVLGRHMDGVAEEAARYAPVVVVDATGLEHPLAEPCARTIADVVKSRGVELVAAASSTFAKDIVPRAAALLGGAMASDVVRHEWDKGRLLLDCPRYAGAVTATVVLHGSPQFVTVRGSSYPATEPAGTPSSLERLELPQATFVHRARYEGLQSKRSARPDVSEARIVVSGGRALKSAEDFERYVGGLADVLGAATGSSRALVDAGIAPNELQVGQTGKIVAPELYLALGISGAVQHLAGMKNSKKIAAINSDPDAPIFEVADFGLVGDVYAVVPELIKRLERNGASVSR
jgi:electron transfer flavoprotein alpha subunit